MNTYIGIDGCRGGWVFTVLRNNIAQIQLFRTLVDGINILLDASSISIDMPIGLVDDENIERTCDSLIRKEIGYPYSSSVFNVPCKQAVYASDYISANILNRKITGKGISIQSWNIVPKIKELDMLLLNHPVLKDKIFESHPELVFKMLNGSTLDHKKKTPEGINIRKQLLNRVINNSIDAFTIARNQLHKKDALDDDIVDSMILSYNALKIHEGFFIQFPEADTFNNQEIRMNVRIWNGV